MKFLFCFLLGNSQLEYLTYQEIKRNKGIVYSICLSYTVLCKRLSLGHMQINAVAKIASKIMKCNVSTFKKKKH